MSASKAAVAIVQISSCVDAEGNVYIHGIDRNGSAYQYMWGKSPIPKESLRSPQEYGPSYFWWKPLRMETTKGPEPEVDAAIQQGAAE